ncbi:hypothetical protein QLL95_gp0507 [Cotonvirus japonicus]|uniref:Uncharacterized protein n=1 Tax=Cotonvirus japonicus TaxID=2811091 RepID=A0ABM7NU33_9VIRU|nr:hypothetical protein QLL95_gp0507 [Cotonvirus japonicus]BCS83616.1 hypothetical protein [Cotonvirus japonicus]
MSKHNYLVDCIEKDYFSWKDNVSDWIYDEFCEWEKCALECSSRSQVNDSFYQWQNYINNVISNEHNDLLDYYDGLISDGQ